MALYTVFGGRGFIGSEIVKQLNSSGHDVFVPIRNDERIFKEDLGFVIYCAGYGDCSKPFDVLEANVSLLSRILKNSKFESLVYVSSTRVYMNNDISSEQADLKVCMDDNRRLFNLSKLLAEELCFKSERNVCVVRPSNVYGLAINSPLFLPAITRNAIKNKKIDMYISQNYCKDYISVTNVAEACIELVSRKFNRHEIINIASGYNINAKQIADVLQNYTNCKVIWHEIDFPSESFPITDISSIKNYIQDYKPNNLLDDLKDLILDFKSIGNFQ
ncbi:NAD-dependent epimerase/dehydratase family protein [Pseudoalteromonas sp. 10-33]|uniref:NAD-dependent epimerase/dehydratase family protein n=1 Tax=Pseudoalteromonas sp. 10-33 TaxID=1761890 RepID=UPI0007322EBD|nr:NAD(P)-dependent oxidoreductase [Pseudoalteromonas sp. 10-33]KTF19191.1 dTDP-glucose 4,6-dehydratase [Pseudoalteromonas sp. 10-33]